MMLKFEKNKQQTYVLMELLANVVGYDSLWRVAPGSGGVQTATLGAALEQGKQHGTVNRVQTRHEGQG
jgi:hypothetical protein